MCPSRVAASGLWQITNRSVSRTCASSTRPLVKLTTLRTPSGTHAAWIERARDRDRLPDAPPVPTCARGFGTARTSSRTPRPRISRTRSTPTARTVGGASCGPPDDLLASAVQSDVTPGAQMGPRSQSTVGRVCHGFVVGALATARASRLWTGCGLRPEQIRCRRDDLRHPSIVRRLPQC